MAGLPSRHRSLFLLAGVVLLQVLMLAVQIKRDSQGRLIRVWTVSAVSPVERSGAWGIGKVRDAWRHYFALSDTARQNEDLIRENGQPVPSIGGDGGFRYFTEPLEPGEHSIVIVGQNRRGGTAKQQVTIVVPK